MELRCHTRSTVGIRCCSPNQRANDKHIPNPSCDAYKPATPVGGWKPPLRPHHCCASFQTHEKSKKDCSRHSCANLVVVELRSIRDRLLEGAAMVDSSPRTIVAQTLNRLKSRKTTAFSIVAQATPIVAQIKSSARCGDERDRRLGVAAAIHSSP